MACAVLVSVSLVSCTTISDDTEPLEQTQRPLPFTKFTLKKQVQLPDDSPLTMDGDTDDKDGKAKEPDAILNERVRPRDERPALRNKPLNPSIGKGQADEKIKLTLNLQAATVEHIVMAFADKNVLDFNYLVDPAVKGAISLNMNDVEMSRKDAWELLEHLLWLSGAYMSESNNFVHVLPFEKMPKEQKLYVNHEKQPNVQAMFVDIKYRKSADVINFLKPFMTDGATATDIPDSNTIVIVETPGNVEKLLELIKRLDAKGEGAWPVKCFSCRDVDPETLAAELKTLLPVLGFPVAPENGPSGGAIKIAALPRLNAIVVSASMEDVLTEISKWIRTLDQENKDDKEGIYFYDVKSSTVEILSASLDAFFNTETTTSPSSRSSSSSSTSTSTRSSTRTSSRNRNSNTSGLSNTSNSRSGNTATNRNSRNTSSTSSSSRYQFGNRNTGNNNTNATGNRNATLTVFETEVTVFTEEESNRLTIKTTPRAWKTIKAFLQRQDVAPRQVAIQAVITEISLTETTDYGISYSIEKIIRSGDDTLSGAFAGAGIIGADTTAWTSGGLGILFKDAKSDPLAFVKAVAGEGNTKVLSEPQIVARSGATAELQVGQSIPVPTESTNYTNSSGNFSTNYEYVETGVIMSVTPFITAGNEVRLEIEQEVSSAGTQTNTAVPPTIDKKTMSTELVVPDNTTILMGGMIRTTKNETRSGIPLLMDIPYLGRLFSSNYISDARTELLVLITVNVIDNKQPQEELLRKYKASLEAIEEHNNREPRY